MELKITENKKNALLSRIDVYATLTFEGATPTRKEVVKEIAKQLKAKEELVIVREIKTAFGKTSASVTATVYDKKEVMEKVEVKRMIEKHNFPADAPKEEAKAEPAKEEAPKAEEKAQEAPKEEAKAEPAKEKADEPAKEGE